MKKETILLAAFLTFSAIGYSVKKEAYIVYQTDSKTIYGICFTNKGGALGIADITAIKVYSTENNKLLNEFKNGHKKQILTINISKDSTLLVSGGRDSTIVLWDFINGRILKTLTFSKGIVTSVFISSDGRYLLSGGSDKMIFLYDIQKDKVIHEFSDHSDDITAVKFSPDGRFIASASGDGLINLYDAGNFKLIASLKGHRSWVRDISFSSDGTKLISCGDDSRVITWNISETGSITIAESLNEGFGWLLSVDLYEDSKTYVTGGIDGKIRIVTDFGKFTSKIRTPVNKVIFKPKEGTYLKVAIATRGKGVFLIGPEEM
jgi:WD40 repeat protein